VIEAHRDIRVNDEVWRTSLSGIVPRQAILPDRTVRSDAIADLRIDKYELGTVRNSYSPGWLNRWWGANKPF
ncbi:MAG: flagellar basal body L-ring protein FlgH, partial [Planctomycetota bacterium]